MSVIHSVVVMTGWESHSEESRIELELSPGAADALTKPLPPADLLDAVETALEDRERRAG